MNDGRAAHAGTGATELELELLLLGLEQAYAADFTRCSRALVAEAVDELLALRGLPSPAALLHESLHDAGLGRQAVATLGACELTLFADPEFFVCFKERVVPWLRTYPFLSVWAVQCGEASDLYSVAILLDEAGLSGRTRIYATEAGGARLACARASLLAPASIRMAERNYRLSGGSRPFASYLERAGGMMAMAHRIKRNIVWAQYSLESGQSFNEFNLILCRDVLSGMPPGNERRALGVLTDSLSLSGLLALGISEKPQVPLFTACYREWEGVAGVHQRTC